MDVLGYKTTTPEYAVDSRISNIAHNLQSAVDSGGLTSTFPRIIEEPMPMIFTLTGVARTGKDTFVDSMKEIPGLSEYACDTVAIHMSTVDPPRNAVNHILHEERLVAPFHRGEDLRPANEVIDDKDDKYRDFIFDVKQAWEKHYNGATNYSIGRAVATACSLGSKCSGIFIDSREMDSIERIVAGVKKHGLIAMKLLLINEHNLPADWKNGSDSNIVIDPSHYDVAVHIDGDIEHTKAIGRTFIEALRTLNLCYGVPVDHSSRTGYLKLMLK